MTKIRRFCIAVKNFVLIFMFFIKKWLKTIQISRKVFFSAKSRNSYNPFPGSDLGVIRILSSSGV
tara:strand:- start:254 stop:448 length:195 start_codon:yes stop_codon:yes gene_type:complete